MQNLKEPHFTPPTGPQQGEKKWNMANSWLNTLTSVNL
jgi:hypothetical protein